jgi:O-antigen/teichoic acid export membrane protein
MSRKLLLTLLVAALAALIVFLAARWIAPPGIETKGSDSSLTIQYVSLATAIVSLLTAIVGLLKGALKKQSSGDT